MGNGTRLRLGVIFLILNASLYCSAQTPDIFRAEYMLMPKNASEAQLSRIKLVANLPIKVKDSNAIIIGGEYNRLVYDLPLNNPFMEQGPKKFHVVDFNMAYVYKYNSDWRFVGVLTPRLSSTLINGPENGDFSVNATIGALKDRQNIDKPMRLVLGIAYNSTVALRIPLPIIYYEKRFHPNWTYVVGAPKSGMKYHYLDRHTFQTEFILDGYYVNLQNTLVLPDTGFASTISSSAALVTLGYQYNITKVMGLYAYIGHTLFQKGVLRDNERNDVFILNDNSSLYFRTGFRIGL